VEIGQNKNRIEQTGLNHPHKDRFWRPRFILEIAEPIPLTRLRRLDQLLWIAAFVCLATPLQIGRGGWIRTNVGFRRRFYIPFSAELILRTDVKRF
jgi:hypothetical protein